MVAAGAPNAFVAGAKVVVKKYTNEKKKQWLTCAERRRLVGCATKRPAATAEYASLLLGLLLLRLPKCTRSSSESVWLLWLCLAEGSSSAEQRVRSWSGGLSSILSTKRTKSRGCSSISSTAEYAGGRLLGWLAKKVCRGGGLRSTKRGLPECPRGG